MATKGTIRPDVAFRELAANRKSKKGNVMEIQVDVAHVESQEVPATIVEGTEAQVFEGQVNTKAEVPSEEVKEVEVLKEEPAPKPPRISKRPYIETVKNHLEIGDLDKKELVALVLEKFPVVKKSGIETFLTDVKNVRYSHFTPRVAVVHPLTQKLIFADRLVITQAAVEEVQPTEAQPEQPAE
ncbi:MAG: hypothetical protein ABSF52_11435 [Syntrophobacteraceae bacterium]